MRGNAARRLMIATGLVLALGGCSSVGDFFGDLFGASASNGGATASQQQAALPMVPMAGAAEAAQPVPQAAAPSPSAPQATAPQVTAPQASAPQATTPQASAPQAAPRTRSAERATEQRIPPIARRLATLEYLHRNSLIEDADYQARRAANIGGLLPLTHGNRLAVDPEAPAPKPEDVVDRLRRLRDFSQRGLISPSDYQRERGAILNALLPTQGGRRTAPPPPEIDGDEATRRLEALDRWKEANLITDAELEGERKAILAAMNRSVTRFGAPPPKQSDGGAGGAAPAKSTAPEAGPQSANANEDAGSGNFAAAALDFDESLKVHLASFRDRRGAEKGWNDLKKRYPIDLAGLMVEIRRVDLGPDLGVYHRVLAGPFADKDEAKRTCKRIKAKGGYCDPMH